MSSHHKHRRPRHFSLTDASEGDVKSQHRNGKRHHHHHDGKRKKVTALIVKVEENSFINPYIKFDVGLGGKGAIKVSEDGSTFEFRESGLYQLSFSGLIDLGTSNEGEFVFEQIPEQPLQRPFTTEIIYSGRVNVSTMLSFRKGYKLHLLVRLPVNGVPQSPVVGAGSKFQIVKVRDI